LRGLLVAGCALFAFAASLPFDRPGRIPSRVDVTLTATGTKNPISRGTELWLADADRLPIVGRTDNWESRGAKILVSYKDQPASVTLRFNNVATAALELHSHPYSGIAEINIGERRFTYDLYAREPRSVKVQIADLAAEAFVRRSLLPPIIFPLVLGLLLLTGRRLVGLRPRIAIAAAREVDERKATLFVYLSCLAASHVVLTNQAAFGGWGAVLSLAWFLAITTVLLTIAWGVTVLMSGLGKTNIFGRLGVFDVLLTIALFLNLRATLLAAYRPDSLPYIAVVGLCLSSFLLFSMLAAHEPMWRTALVFCAAFLLAMLTSAYFATPPYEIAGHEGVADMGPSPASHAPQTNTKRPNIYFISLDAIGSERALRRLLNLDRLPLWELMDHHGFQIGESRSPAAATLATFYEIFTQSAGPSNGRPDFLNGHDANPIIERVRRAVIASNRFRDRPILDFSETNGITPSPGPVHRSIIAGRCRAEHSFMDFAMCRNRLDWPTTTRLARSGSSGNGSPL
jgi:hypothetical protein